MKNGQPYHIPTYQMAIESGEMSGICRTNGCVHAKQSEQLGQALFEVSVPEKTDEPAA